jgi:hypothetical protein
METVKMANLRQILIYPLSAIHPNFMNLLRRLTEAAPAMKKNI